MNVDMHKHRAIQPTVQRSSAGLIRPGASSVLRRAATIPQLPMVFLTVALFFGLAGCAHVPPEAVQLSYQIGEDLPRLLESYDNLIHDRFEDFRTRRRAYVDEVWAPTYLEKWIEKGRLVDVAKGVVVWSFESGSFTPPDPGREKAQLLATVKEWTEKAVARIETKRQSLLAPLDEDERTLRGQVHEAFSRLMQANAYVTAHLASLRHVEEAQNEALQALKMKDLRDSINATLVKASENAAKGLDEVRKADGFIDKAAHGLDQLQQ